jgi:hypothetical protein
LVKVNDHADATWPSQAVGFESKALVAKENKRKEMFCLGGALGASEATPIMYLHRIALHGIT